MKLFRSFGSAVIKAMEQQASRLDERMLYLYGIQRSRQQEFIYRLCFQFSRLLHFLTCGTRCRVILLRGREASTQMPYTAACVTRRRTEEFFSTVLFDGCPETQEERDGCWAWQAGSRAAALVGETDLVILERNTLMKWTPRQGDWAATPHRVRMVTRFAPGETWDQYRRKLPHQRNNIKRFERFGYARRISHDERDFDFFYERMYLPTVTCRHCDFAVIERKEVLRPDFERGMLVFVDDRQLGPIAGLLAFVTGENTLMCVVSGVLDGSPELMEKRAACGVYITTLQWALENGMRQVDMGPVFPFADDGVYVHKKRWGFAPSGEYPWQDEWLVWSPRQSQPARAWLRSHAFVPDFARWGGDWMASVYSQPVGTPTETIPVTSPTEAVVSPAFKVSHEGVD